MQKFVNTVIFLSFCIAIHTLDTQSISTKPLMVGASIFEQPLKTHKQNCKCLNDGECYIPVISQISQEQVSYCKCSIKSIGQICQQKASQLKIYQQTSQRINIHEYKYYYYEPIQQNTYAFSIKICFDEIIVGKTVQQKLLQKKITFFLQLQNKTGGFDTQQNLTQPQTIIIQKDECKYINIHYTSFSITKLKTVQKLILGLKLGQKIQIPIQKKEQSAMQQTIQSSKSLVKSLFPQPHLSYQIYSQQHSPPLASPYSEQKDTNIKKMNQITGSISPSKIQKNDEIYLNKKVTINLMVYPFMVEFLVINILFSLTTTASLVIIGILIFVIRSRLLGIRISRSLALASRLINNLSHFDKYIPSEKYHTSKRQNAEAHLCPICLAKFQQNDIIRKTPCGHIFHKNCLDLWCEQNLTCPMCRRSLTQKCMAMYYSSTQLELKNSPQSRDEEVG